MGDYMTVIVKTKKCPHCSKVEGKSGGLFREPDERGVILWKCISCGRRFSIEEIYMRETFDLP